MPLHPAQLADLVGGSGPSLAPPRLPASSSWEQTLLNGLTALATVHSRLRAGGRVADVLCGPGTVTIPLALTFPRSLFFGYDLDEPALHQARRAAREAGVLNQVYFQTVSPADFPGWDYDVILFPRGLMHLPNPMTAARRVRNSLTSDGHWVLVEQETSEASLRQLLATTGFRVQQQVRLTLPGWLLLEACP